MAKPRISLRHVHLDAPADLIARVWNRDSSAWGPGDDDPSERLGWLDLPRDFAPRVDDLRSFADGVDADTIVLLGMGGSSLAPEVFAKTLPAQRRLLVGDSTHPDQIRADRDSLELDRSIFVVSSKSGGTIETLSLYRYYRSLVPSGDHFVAVTDPGTSLEQLAHDDGFRRTFSNPPDIGGRYSALSYFGLVPAALAGIDLAPVLDGAATMAERCGPDVDPEDNPGLVVGAAIARLAQGGRDKLTFVISEAVASFGDWVEQLIAESTGKHDTGIVPVVGEPVAAVSSYGGDRAFVLLKMAGDSSLDGLEQELDSAGMPTIAIEIGGPDELGAQMFLWEMATAVAGSLLGINAFDQPNVEAAKKASRALLESGEELEWRDDDPAELFEGIEQGELAVVCAFAPRSAVAEDVLARARAKLVAHGVATMAGFGPRYLHSTGQLHKGGPPRVRALVVLAEPDGDEPIPETPYSFARLVRAQAAGDARALEEAGRRVARTTWSTFERWTSST